LARVSEGLNYVKILNLEMQKSNSASAAREDEKMAIDEEVVAETNGVNSSFIGQQEENKNQEGDPHDASLRKSFMSLSP